MTTNRQEADIWENDLLQRSEDADFLIHFLERRLIERHDAGFPKNYVLNIDAEWGQGKTFFLTCLHQQLQSMDRVSAYINAWEDDHAADPMIAVMAQINKAISPYIKKRELIRNSWKNVKSNSVRIVGAFAKGVSKQAAKRLIGEGIDEISDLVIGSEPTSDADTTAEHAGKKSTEEQINAILDKYADQLIAEFDKQSESIKSFRSNLSNMIDEINKLKNATHPFYVLIDELDRCRPDYAILLLERIKHIFAARNVVFIIATDTAQLRYAVSAVYGERLDGTRYLQRFFDRTFTFREVNLEVFVDNLFEKYVVNEKILSAPKVSLRKYFSDFMFHCNVNLRDIEKCFDIMRGVITIWKELIEIELAALLPLIILFNSRDLKHYNALKVGNFDCLNDSPMNNQHSYPMMYHLSDKYEEAATHNLDIIKAMFKQMKLPLSDRSRPSSMWVDERFQKEFQVRFRSTFDRFDPPYSIMRSYPALVEGSGRLTIK